VYKKTIAVLRVTTTKYSSTTGVHHTTRNKSYDNQKCHTVYITQKLREDIIPILSTKHYILFWQLSKPTQYTVTISPLLISGITTVTQHRLDNKYERVFLSTSLGCWQKMLMQTVTSIIYYFST